MVAMLGEGACFSINAASFLAVLTGLWLIRMPALPPAEPAGSALGQMKEGFLYLRQDRHAAALIGVMGAANLAAAPLWALMPFFADSIFRKGSAGTGFLTASMGAGAVAGMLGLASRASTRGLDAVVFSNATGLAISMAAFAVSPDYVFSMVTMGGVGYFLMRMNGASNTLVQSAVPEHLRGRVMGLFAAANVGVIPIGSLGGGALAALWGPRWVVGLAAAACAATAWLFHRRYRQ
jgi:predicted MFS family arabinose efflux permease